MTHLGHWSGFNQNGPSKENDVKLILQGIAVVNCRSHAPVVAERGPEAALMSLLLAPPAAATPAAWLSAIPRVLTTVTPPPASIPRQVAGHSAAGPHPRAGRTARRPPQAPASPAPQPHPHRPLQRGGEAARQPAPHPQRPDRAPAGPGLRRPQPAPATRRRRGRGLRLPPALPEAEILTRLVRLNHERAAEEAAGHVRYLRPAYQAPETEQAALALPAAAATAVAPAAIAPQA